MIIKLYELRKSGISIIEAEKNPSELGLSQTVFLKPIEIKIVLENAGELINADFHLSTYCHRVCDRCVVEFELEIDAHHLMRFIPETNKSYYAGGDDDVKYYHPDNPLVDVSGDIHDALMLAIPMKVLCREDCRGLCPHCGADLNVEDCNCGKTQVDPRWSKLVSLKGKMSSD